MALPIDKQANLVEGIVNCNVTFAEDEEVMFVGKVMSQEEREQIKDAIAPEDIFNPDDRVTRVDVSL